MSYLLPTSMTRQNAKEERIFPSPPPWDGSGTSQAPVNQQQLCQQRHNAHGHDGSGQSRGSAKEDRENGPCL